MPGMMTCLALGAALVAASPALAAAQGAGHEAAGDSRDSIHWCPAGTEPMVTETPVVREKWCRKDGLRHGRYAASYPSGARKEAGRYRHGEAEGQWTYWYENGQMRMQGRRRSGAISGRWTYWYDNGQKRMEGRWRFKDGKRTGKWTYWTRDGERRAEGEWRDGKKEGVWHEMTRDGEMKWVGYANGVRLRESVRITMDALHEAGGVPPRWKFLPPAGDPDAGRRLYVDFGCHSCHAVEGEAFPQESRDETEVGPELTGMGSHHPPGYFAESIVNPNAVLVEGPGYIGPDGASRMPVYPDMTLTQLADLVAYLGTLTVDGCQHGN
jgi:mono/diheme cytochrome c family protein